MTNSLGDALLYQNVAIQVQLQQGSPVYIFLLSVWKGRKDGGRGLTTEKGIQGYMHFLISGTQTIADHKLLIRVHKGTVSRNVVCCFVFFVVV